MKLTPLHLAAASGDAATTAALLRCDLPGCCEAVLAWTTARDAAGRTPSSVAAASSCASLRELGASVCRQAADARALATSAREAVACGGGIVCDEHEIALAESLLEQELEDSLLSPAGARVLARVAVSVLAAARHVTASAAAPLLCVPCDDVASSDCDAALPARAKPTLAVDALSVCFAGCATALAAFPYRAGPRYPVLDTHHLASAA